MELLALFIERNWLFLVIIGVLLYLLACQRPNATRLESLAAFKRLIWCGTPVLVEFYDPT